MLLIPAKYFGTQRHILNAIRFYVSVYASMTKATEDLEPEQVFFRGPTTIILSATNIEHVVSLQISEINNKIEEFVRNGKTSLYFLSFKI